MNQGNLKPIEIIQIAFRLDVRRRNHSHLYRCHSTHRSWPCTRIPSSDVAEQAWASPRLLLNRFHLFKLDIWCNAFRAISGPNTFDSEMFFQATSWRWPSLRWLIVSPAVHCSSAAVGELCWRRRYPGADEDCHVMLFILY